MPHVPLDASDQFKGKSQRGLYGDVIEELGWNVGRVLDKVNELGLDESTIIIIYTSDNGPWPLWTGPEESGSTGPLRGQKTETWDGGVRVPFIVRAPGIVPAGTVCDGMIGDVDMLPTFAAWASVELPDDRIVDGKNLVPLMTGQVTETPVKERYFYYDSHLQAVRSGQWKLILPRPATPNWTAPVSCSY
jgi:arylsulfatase